MKRTKITFSLLVVALVSVFALMLGITASAADEANIAPSIDYATVVFDDAVHLRYFVKSDDVGETKLLVWRNVPENCEFTKETAEEIINSYGNDDISVPGEVYKAFTYTNITAKEMGDTVYTRVLYTNGETELYSDVNKYSILKYAYNQLGKTKTNTPDEKLEKLLNSMLLYGASSQEFFEYDLERLVTKDFYQISVTDCAYITYDNSKYHLGLEGDTVEICAPDRDAEGKDFQFWIDSNGKAVSRNLIFTVSVGAANEIYTPFYDFNDPYDEIYALLDEINEKLTELECRVDPATITPGELDEIYTQLFVELNIPDEYMLDEIIIEIEYLKSRYEMLCLIVDGAEIRNIMVAFLESGPITLSREEEWRDIYEDWQGKLIIYNQKFDPDQLINSISGFSEVIARFLEAGVRIEALKRAKYEADLINSEIDYLVNCYPGEIPINEDVENAIISLQNMVDSWSTEFNIPVDAYDELYVEENALLIDKVKLDEFIERYQYYEAEYNEMLSEIIEAAEAIQHITPDSKPAIDHAYEVWEKYFGGIDLTVPEHSESVGEEFLAYIQDKEEEYYKLIELISEIKADIRALYDAEFVIYDLTGLTSADWAAWTAKRDALVEARAAVQVMIDWLTSNEGLAQDISVIQAEIYADYLYGAVVAAKYDVVMAIVEKYEAYCVSDDEPYKATGLENAKNALLAEVVAATTAEAVAAIDDAHITAAYEAAIVESLIAYINNSMNNIPYNVELVGETLYAYTASDFELINAMIYATNTELAEIEALVAELARYYEYEEAAIAELDLDAYFEYQYASVIVDKYEAVIDIIEEYDVQIAANANANKQAHLLVAKNGLLDQVVTAKTSDEVAAVLAGMADAYKAALAEAQTENIEAMIDALDDEDIFTYSVIKNYTSANWAELDVRYMVNLKADLDAVQTEIYVLTDEYGQSTDVIGNYADFENAMIIPIYKYRVIQNIVNEYEAYCVQYSDKLLELEMTKDSMLYKLVKATTYDKLYEVESGITASYEEAVLQ